MGLRPDQVEDAADLTGLDADAVAESRPSMSNPYQSSFLSLQYATSANDGIGRTCFSYNSSCKYRADPT